MANFLGDYTNSGRASDVLCLQEASFETGDEARGKQKLKHPDYEDPIRQQNKNNEKRGIAILVKKGINCVVVDQGNKEWGESITVEIRKKHQPTLYVSNVYWRYGTNHQNIKLEHYTNFSETNHVICGDFNAHNTIWGSEKTNARGKNLEGQMLNLGLKCINTGEITRISQHQKEGNSCIDLTLVTELNDLEEIFWEIDEYSYGSDHRPQHITIGRDYHQNPIPPQLLRYNTQKMEAKDCEK